MTCPTCGGILVVEPAILRCRVCGRERNKPGSSALDRARQRAVDECFTRPGETAQILDELLAAPKRRVRQV